MQDYGADEIYVGREVGEENAGVSMGVNDWDTYENAYGG